jgi:hypothetical protein
MSNRTFDRAVPFIATVLFLSLCSCGYLNLGPIVAIVFLLICAFIRDYVISSGLP